ncbi:putative secreted protein [Naviculisporaceae sp. PSN 640]
MKLTTILVTLCASLASAGVVITKITKEQVVVKNDDDCFFGVTTPQGCGPLRD